MPTELIAVIVVTVYFAVALIGAIVYVVAAR